MLRLTHYALAGLFVFCLAGQAVAQESLRLPTSMDPVASDFDYAYYAPQKAAPSSPVPAPAPADESLVEAEEEEEEDKGFKLFDCPVLTCNNIDVRGWIQQGYTWNPDRPADRFNGPVGYNDRSNDYQLNQLYLIGERITETDGCGFDVGGRVDLLYGMDRRFVTAFGLDSDWNVGERFYGLAMPQMYGDIAVNDLVIRAGHFLAPCGSESVMAPENFFYSHSYAFLYGQPTTLSGGQAIYKVDDRFSVNAGLDTGWNNWESPTGIVNYFGGFNWTSRDQRRTLAFETFIGNTNPVRGVDSDRFHYCLVFTQKIGCKWRYTFENNLGYDTNPFGTGEHGDWLAFGNYLFYDINDCWSLGVRYEWMDDDDGTVVTRVGPPTAGPWESHWNAISTGVNYKPNKNLIVRSEVRWDWSSDLPLGPPFNRQRPFDDGTDNDQFLWATDLIVRF